MIEVKNLCTGYSRDKPLLNDFNYKFESKKIYGILGHSGCGKTTLLRTIAGLTKPLFGEVLIDDSPVGKAGRNGIYMMHQNYTSFDWLRCIDNVLISKKVKGKVDKEDIDKAIYMLSLVGLSGHEDKFPKQLSGGMRQRLALARTLFTNPKIILMDEPLSALDNTTRIQMQDLILKVHEETENIIVMVTHSQTEANKMCDKIIKL